jgi:hypothetical protein
MTAPAEAAAKPLLDLSTLDPLERPFILIDGERYDLMVPGDFGLIALNKLDQMSAKVTEMQARQKGEVLSDEDAAELTAVLGTVVGQILRAPAEVIEKLSDIQRLAVLGSFMPASSEAAPAKPRNPRARRRTGESSSRASRASTAPATG